MFAKHYRAFIAKHYRAFIGSVLALFIVCGILWTLQHKMDNSATANAEQQASSDEPPKMRVADFRENQEELRTKYPALPIWNTPHLKDEHIVEYINFVIATSMKRSEELGSDIKTPGDALAYANALTEKWGDPQKTSELRKHTDELIRKAEAFLAGRQERKLRRDRIRKAAEELIADLKARESRQQYQGVIDTEHHSQVEEMWIESFQTFNDEGSIFSESTEAPPDNEVIPSGTPVDEVLRQELPNLPDFTEELGIPFSADEWRDNFRSEVSEWKDEFFDSYPNVVTATYLSPKEFDEVFPTEDARRELQARQRQMQADIATRVQNLLSDNAPGNRAEKLSIIRETLSENWDEDTADVVLERLQ